MENNITYINLVDTNQLAIEGFPHIIKQLSACWGYPEFLNFYNSLILNDRDEPRAGFPDEVLDDLSFLYTLYLHNFADLQRPDVTEQQMRDTKKEIAGDAIWGLHRNF